MKAQAASIDQECQDKAREKFQEMTSRICIDERWHTVSVEMGWHLSGQIGGSKHKKLLPDYCYHIFDLYRRTLFKVYHPFTEIIKPKAPDSFGKCHSFADLNLHASIVWEKVGSVLNMGQRSFQFFEGEAAAMLMQLGSDKLSETELSDIEKLLTNPAWQDKWRAMVSPDDPTKPVEQIIEEGWNKAEATTKQGLAQWEQNAYEAGPEALAAFKAGAAKGVTGFLNTAGEMHGERRLKKIETYSMLLLAWPEISEMLAAKPAKRMEDLWNWLAPFSYAGWIEIKDLDQLVTLCRPIKLRLKKPGAPQKPRES